MVDNFKRALDQVLKWEGSRFTNDPDDRGGATRYGVIQTRYDQFRDNADLPRQSVRAITMPEVEHIYRRYYWDAVKADDLPAPLDTVVFDAGVNHGTGRAAEWLQKLVGVDADGLIGAKTLAAVKAATSDAGMGAEKALATRYCDRREAFYEAIAQGRQRKFLKGWMNRLQDLRKLFGLRDTDGVNN